MFDVSVPGIITNFDAPGSWRTASACRGAAAWSAGTGLRPGGAGPRLLLLLLRLRDHLGRLPRQFMVQGVDGAFERPGEGHSAR